MGWVVDCGLGVELGGRTIGSDSSKRMLVGSSGSYWM